MSYRGAVVAELLSALVIAAPAVLPHSHGWSGGTARIPNSSCPRCVQVDSWVSTVRYRDAPNEFPHKTIATLGPADAILIVIRSWQPAPPVWMKRQHPLRIERSQIHANFEGNTTHGRVSLWAATTWRNGSAVEVYVYFGSPVPSRAAVKRVQRELDAARFPRWSIR